MKMIGMPGRCAAVTIAVAVVLTAGCSGSREDVRVTLCKNLTKALVSSSESIEWTGGENTFNRPAYAITSLAFEVGGSTKKSACHYAYEALEDTAQTLADPLSAYANLPFKMSFDGHALSDQELLRLVNAEQVRQGRQVVEKLEKGARDMADKVRSGIGQ